jgi:hypothetical protein
MPKSLLLNIPEPCQENWQNMTPQEQGRFCGSCQKIVVDFSVMTDKEVLAYFSKASQQVCGRFSNDQLNKELTTTPARKRITWAYVWNVLLASVLVTKTYAQGKPQLKKPPVKTTINEKRTMGEYAGIDLVEMVIPIKMKGVVLDAQNNQPVTGASINIKGTQNGTSADTTGNFQLRVEMKNTLELEFSAIGYEPQTMLLDKTATWEHVRVLLKPAAAVLQEVTVLGFGNMSKVAMVGSVTRGIVPTRMEKINRVVNEWMPAALKKDVKVYPNPVMRGNAIQVKLNLPQEGEYRLELLNTAGQVILVQPLFMQTKEQQIDLYTQTKWSAGIYYVRISSPRSKKVFEAKVLLQ